MVKFTIACFYFVCNAEPANKVCLVIHSAALIGEH